MIVVNRRRALQALSLLPVLAAAGSARAEDSTASTAPGALGYLPWWMAGGWQSMPLSRLERLVLFDAPIEPDGRLVDRDWPASASGLFGHAARERVRIDLALTLLNEDDVGRVFGNPAARDRLFENCARWLEQPFIAGLHLDIEGFAAAAPRTVSGFRAWLGALDEKRRRLGKGLSAFFPASDEFALYDAGAARRIDYWVAQLYDAHWPDSKHTGPLVTRVEDNPVAVPRALARLTALGVARRAILLSVPLYGWQWPSESHRPGAAARGRARLLTFAETPQALMPNDRLDATGLAQRHGLRRDREHTPYFAYREGEHWIQGWYEDLRSLKFKFAAERTQGYAGLAFFALGYDKGEIVDPLLSWWASQNR